MVPLVNSKINCILNIIDLLDKVKNEHYTVALATAKPEVYAREIFRSFFYYTIL